MVFVLSLNVICLFHSWQYKIYMIDRLHIFCLKVHTKLHNFWQTNTFFLVGLFLYLAVTALYGNQMFERILLFFMEQAAYPPNHYVRMVPENIMHRFTGCQLLQLAILCALGFNPWPYAKMIFPLVILAFLPIRHKLIPYILEKKYLDVLDGGDWLRIKMNRIDAIDYYKIRMNCYNFVIYLKSVIKNCDDLNWTDYM